MSEILIVSFEVVECCECGISFAMTEKYYNKKRRDHKYFYCPKGHQQYYAGKSDLEVIKNELRIANEYKEEYKQLWNDEFKSKAAIKGHLTRAKKRVGNGVCPCCSRHFKNLENHMNNKHPDYGKK